MKTIGLCGACGEPEAKHHEFAPVRIPDACICPPSDWGNPFDIPMICRQYEPNEDPQPVCKACEHEEPCHTRRPSPGDAPAGGKP